MDLDLRTILSATIGALVAVWVPPMILAGIRLAWAWVQIRREDLQDELTIRKALALMGHLQRNPGRPGKTWFIHEPENMMGEGLGTKFGDSGQDDCKV